MTRAEVQGTVEPGFEPVRDAFIANFTDRGEVGAACCVYLDARPVLDICGGETEGHPWTTDTPVMVFSTTKGITAICVHMLVERGVLDVDAPVASYWPEFGAEGKHDIPLRWVLSHRAGVPAIDAPATVDDMVGWDGVVAAVAAQKPIWEPGTSHGYHVRSYGWILGEVVRRATGRTLSQFLADEVAGPLGLDFWIGLPAEIESRVAPIIPPAPPTPEVEALMARILGPDTLGGRALRGPGNLFAYDQRWNTRPYRAAQLPSSNGIGTAGAVARAYAATVTDVDGVRLLQPETVARATTLQSDGPDRVLVVPTQFGLGFSLPPMLGPCPPGAFGHPGAGGSLGFADPRARLGFGYAMSRMKLGAERDERAASLVTALYDCL